MWIGTKRGLFSYNGYNLHKMQKDSTYVEVESMIVIGKYLCISTQHGLVWFNTETNSFENIHKCILSDMPCRALALIDEKLWIGTRDSGLYCLDLENNEVKPISSPGWSESLVYSIEDAGDLVYIGSYECLSCYDKTTKTRKIINYTDDGINHAVSRIAWDKIRNCLWICASDGLFRLDKGQDIATEILPLHGISTKNVLVNGEELLLNSDSGLFEYDLDNETLTQYTHSTFDATSIANNVLFGISKDNSGNIWVGTERGVSISPAKNGVTDIKLLAGDKDNEGNVFTHIVKDPDGSLWFGGDNGLIHAYIYNNVWAQDWYKVNDPKFPIAHNTIRDIYFDKHGMLWIATDSNIAHFDRQSKQFIFHKILTKNNLNSLWSYGIYEDKHENLWIGAYKGGLIRVNRDELLASNPSKTFIADSTDEKINSALGRIIFQIIPDEHDNLWLSSQNGIMYFNTKQKTIEPIDLYTNLFAYTPGRLWSCTDDKLVTYDIEKKKVTELNFDLKDGLVYTFIPKDNEIWFSTAEGIYSIDMVTLAVHPTQLPLFFCSSGLYVPEDRAMILGGEDKLKEVDLTRYNINHNQDSLFVSNIIIDGQLQPKLGNEFDVTRNAKVSLELSSYRFARNKEEIYYYNIDDNGWEELPRGENILFFNQLSSGRHEIQLCRFDRTIHPEAPITICSINVAYPWYVQWWAILIYIALVGTGITYLVKYTQRRERKIIELQKSEDPFVVEVNNIIEENMSNEEFNVAMLAEKLNISQKMLNRKLKPLIDVTPVTYIRRKRMQTAAALLRESRDNIQEIMFKVGYSSPSYFSKCFSDEYGTSPTEYRNKK